METVLTVEARTRRGAAAKAEAGGMVVETTRCLNRRLPRWVLVSVLSLVALACTGVGAWWWLPARGVDSPDPGTRLAASSMYGGKPLNEWLENSRDLSHEMRLESIAALRTLAATGESSALLRLRQMMGEGPTVGVQLTAAKAVLEVEPNDGEAVDVVARIAVLHGDIRGVASSIQPWQSLVWPELRRRAERPGNWDREMAVEAMMAINPSHGYMVLSQVHERLATSDVAGEETIARALLNYRLSRP